MFLSSNANPDTILIPSDKGNLSVFMYRVTYHNSVMEHLGDSLTYNLLPSDPSPRILEQAKTLRSMVFGEVLQYNKDHPDSPYAYPKDSFLDIAVFKGLPKVHTFSAKPSPADTIPLRPILEFNRCPSSSLATWTHSINSPLNLHSMNALNSSDVFQRIGDIHVPLGTSMLFLTLSRILPYIRSSNWLCLSLHHHRYFW